MMNTTGQPKPNATRRIRIAVAIAPTGDWECRGWGYRIENESDGELLGDLADGSVMCDNPGARAVFVEADVQIPGDIETEIEGEVAR